MVTSTLYDFDENDLHRKPIITVNKVLLEDELRMFIYQNIIQENTVASKISFEEKY